MVTDSIFVYGLLDPRDRTCFYVGQTTRGKLEPEGYIRYGGTGCPRRKVKRYIRRLMKLGLTAAWEVLEECSIRDLSDVEMFWISSLRSCGANICNMTDGGEGTRGVKRTLESRIKGGQRQKQNPKQREFISKRAESNRGKVRSEITRLRISNKARARASPLKGSRRGRWEIVVCSGCGISFEKLFRKGKETKLHFHDKDCQMLHFPRKGKRRREISYAPGQMKGKNRC